MKQSLRFLILCATSLSLTGCGDTAKRWLDPDATFKSLPQPEVKGVNDTQEEMAKEAANNGDYGRAIKFYEVLVAAEKGTPEQKLRYKLGLAESARRVGENERALAMFDQLSRENPTNIDALEGKGLSLLALGKSSEASRTFAEVMTTDTKRWRTLNALGILFVSKNMIPEALAYYNEAIKYSPDNAAVLNNMGLSYAIDHNFPRGIEVLEQAARVSKTAPQRKQIELNEALVFGISGDLDRAKDMASKHLQGPALDNNMGLYAHLAKDDALAKTYLNMALSQSPTFYERAWNNLDSLNNGSAPTRSKPTDTKPKL